MDKEIFLLAASIKGSLFRWPSVLRRGSAAAPFLGLQVRVPPCGMDVSLL